MNVGWNGVHRLSGLGISMHMSKMVNVPAIMMMVYRRGAQCAPEQRKIERFVGEQCSPLRLRVCMWVTYGDHQSRKKQPSAKSRFPQEDAARKEDENGHARNPVQQACKPPVREVPERHAAVERGHGQQVEQPEQGTRAGKPICAERVRQCGERKAGRRSGEADGGARKRRRRQAAPQDSAAGGQAQGVHRAAGQPNDKKVSALMYSRRQQENGEHAALIRAPERSHEHKKAVADLNPAHSAR